MTGPARKVTPSDVERLRDLVTFSERNSNKLAEALLERDRLTRAVQSILGDHPRGWVAGQVVRGLLTLDEAFEKLEIVVEDEVAA